jgi:hypothetical protein
MEKPSLWTRGPAGARFAEIFFLRNFKWAFFPVFIGTHRQDFFRCAQTGAKSRRSGRTAARSNSGAGSAGT